MFDIIGQLPWLMNDYAKTPTLMQGKAARPVYHTPLSAHEHAYSLRRCITEANTSHC